MRNEEYSQVKRSLDGSHWIARKIEWSRRRLTKSTKYITPGTTRFDPPCSSSRKSLENVCKSVTPPPLKQQPRSRGGGGVTHPQPIRGSDFFRVFFSVVKRVFHVNIMEILQTLQQQPGRVGEGLGGTPCQIVQQQTSWQGGRGTRSNA